MTTATDAPTPAPAPAPPPAPERPLLALYRDDGPLATLIGAVLPARRVPQLLAIAVAAAPMVVLIALKGAAADHAAAGAALAWLILVGSIGAGHAPTDRLRWAAPPLLRAVEYTALLWIGAMGGEKSEPATFTLICVLAFRHYDVVYRLRHQRAAPPAWVGTLALGWDGRLVLGYILLVAGALPAGLFIAAGLLALVFVAESIAGWRRFGRAPQPVTYEDEEDEGQ